MPDHYAQFIANFVEGFVLVNPASPNPQHVHVRFRCLFEQIPISLLRHARQKVIRRNPVCAFAENWHAVYADNETLAFLVWFLHQLNLSQPHFDAFPVNLLLTHLHAAFQSVKRLPAHPVGEPKPWLRDFNFGVSKVLAQL